MYNRFWFAYLQHEFCYGKLLCDLLLSELGLEAVVTEVAFA